jgi:hypothetical protein
VSVVNSKPVPELCKCLASLQHPHQHHGDSLQVSGQSGVMGWPRFLPTSVRFLQWELWTPCSLPCAPAMGTGPLVANTWTRDHSTLQITGPGWKKLSNASCFVDSPSHGEVVLFGKEELEGQEDQGSAKRCQKADKENKQWNTLRWTSTWTGTRLLHLSANTGPSHFSHPILWVRKLRHRESK